MAGEKIEQGIVVELTELDYLQESESGVAYCIECHEPACDYLEPDTQNALCEHCGASEVFGLEQLLIMGRVFIVD